MAKKDQKFDNANSGALFVNNKEGNDKRPDRTGKLVIKADEYEPDADGNVTIILAAWLKNSDNVGEYLSIKAQPPKQD